MNGPAQNPPPNVPPQALALHAEATRLGLIDGVDVAIAYVTPQIGSECVLFNGTPRGFLVLYQDMGDTHTLYGSADFDAAARVFLEEGSWLAAGRGRGPYAGRRRPAGTEGWSLDQVVAAYEQRTSRR